MSYRLAPLAVLDLEDIRSFTIARWSREQWLRYYRDLVEAFARIAEDPRIGRDRSVLGRGLRSLPCGAHLVFWRVSHAGEPVILRIVHARRALEALTFAENHAPR